MKKLLLLACMALLAVPLLGQTTRNGTVTTGLSTALPATCSVGDQFNSTDTGKIYVATLASPCTWTIQLGVPGPPGPPGPGGLVPGTVADANYVPISTAANVVTWEQIASGLDCLGGSHALGFTASTHQIGCNSIASASFPLTSTTANPATAGTFLRSANSDTWGIRNWNNSANCTMSVTGAASGNNPADLFTWNCGGFKASAFSSGAAATATAGLFRLSKDECVDWENNANNAPLGICLNSSDQYTFGSGVLFPHNTFFASGYPQYDVICVGVTATDSAAVNTAIGLAEASSSGGAVVINGNGNTCQLDGTLITIGQFDHSSPLIIQLKGKINFVANTGGPFGQGRGFYVGLAGGNPFNTWFYGIRGGLTTSAFSGGQGAAEVTQCNGSIGAGCNFALFEFAGCQGCIVDGVTAIGTGLNNDGMGGDGHQAPVVFVHSWWDGLNANCNELPCGSTQVQVKNSTLINASSLAPSSSGVPLQISEAPRKRGAWDSGTAYLPGDEVHVGSTYYISVLAGTNHSPPNATYWSGNRITGFDGTFTNNTYSSNAFTYNNDAVLLEDFGNFTFGGDKASWLLGGSLELQFTTETGQYIGAIKNLSNELVAAGKSLIVVTGRTGGSIVADVILPSDNLSGGYMFKAQADPVTGLCGTILIPTNYFQLGSLNGWFDPAGCINGFAIQGLALPELISSLSHPITSLPPIGNTLWGVSNVRNDDGRHNNVPISVRFQNQVSNYAPGTWSGGTNVTLTTTGIADPWGGTTAGRVTATGANWSQPLYSASVTPAVGNVYVAQVAVRANNSDGLNNFGASLNFASGVTMQGYPFSVNACTPTATGIVCDNKEWEWFWTIQKVTATDSMAHTLTFDIGTVGSGGQFDMVAPMVLSIPASAGLSDMEIIDYVRGLTGYPPSCAAGVVCNANGGMDAVTLLTKTWASPAAIGTGTPAGGNFTIVNSSSLTASKCTGTDGSKNLVSDTNCIDITKATPVYNISGTLQATSHMVIGSGTLSTGTLTVTLSGSAVFTSSSTYVCSPDDSTGINGFDVIYTSGSSVTFNGTGSDSFRFVCVGN